MNLHQQSFITEYLRTGDKIQSYKNAYNSESANYNSLESAANRLMRIPEVANTIQGIQNSIRAEVEDELKSQLKQELLTIQQKRELLAQIATGEMYAEQHYKGKNCSQCTQYVKPTINQMLKAIDLDNKLAGHYDQKKKSEPVHSVNLSQAESLSPAGGGDFEEVGGGTIAMDASQEKQQQSQQNTTNNMSLPNAFGTGGVSERDGGGTIVMNKSNASTPLRLSASAVQKSKHPFSQQNRTIRSKGLVRLVDNKKSSSTYVELL